MSIGTNDAISPYVTVGPHEPSAWRAWWRISWDCYHSYCCLPWESELPSSWPAC